MHNLRGIKESLWRAPGQPIVQQAKKLARFLLFSPFFLVAALRHLRFRRFEETTPAYQIRNDTGHGYRMLTYYIDPVLQVAQLGRVGFETWRYSRKPDAASI